MAHSTANIGITTRSVGNESVNDRKFGGKELITAKGFDAYDFEARRLTVSIPRFTQPDPMAEKYYPISLYSYCLGDPVNFVDPMGLNPVFDRYGNFLGTTKEGYTGMVMIYDGSKEIDWNKYSVSEAQAEDVAGWKLFALEDAYVYGVNIDLESLAKILTNVISQYDGKYIFEERFSMKRLHEGKILYALENKGSNFYTDHTEGDPTQLPKIYVTYSYLRGKNYEPTVENLICTILAHEWYSHGLKHQGDSYKTHRLAYQNVINFKDLWDKTTNKYKGHNLNALREYTYKETGRKMVKKPYRRLYNTYIQYVKSEHIFIPPQQKH